MVDIEEGELKEIAQLVPNERIIIKGGPLRMGHSRQEVANRNAPEYPAGLGGTVQTGRDGPVWCLATESDVTLEIDPEGFALVDTFRSFLGIDETQSIGNQPIRTERVPAEGVFYQGFSETANIDAGNSRFDASISADTGEVWELLGFGCTYVPESVEFSWTVDLNTPAPGSTIELAHAQQTDTTVTGFHQHGSDRWFVDDAGESWTVRRSDANRGHRVDDTENIQIVFSNEGSSTITNTRQYGLEWRQVTI